jgi:adenosine deaminase
MTAAAAPDLSLLPKAELHLHIEGTLEPELIFHLAERNRVPMRYSDVDELRSRYKFSSLSDFLALYYDNMAVLVSEADFYDLTRAYLARARSEGLRHVEIFFDPQAHTARGVPLEVVLAGLGEAARASQRDFGVSSALIPNFLRDRPLEEAMSMLSGLLGSDAPIVAVGLDSAEVGNPPARFAALFDLARASGLHGVAHAGEEGPASYVWEALDVLRVQRVDHGVRSMEDPALVDRLRDEGTPLTVCPLSNVVLGGFATLSGHPVAAMLSAGLHVTVNSDDPAYFGGYIGENYARVAATFGLDRAALAQLARNAIMAAFVGPARRAELLDELDRWEGSRAQLVG